jgi:hypothetical protein
MYGNVLGSSKAATMDTDLPLDNISLNEDSATRIINGTRLAKRHSRESLSTVPKPVAVREGVELVPFKAAGGHCLKQPK